ncbi:glycosidase [Sphingomonas sp. NSE70-1]|uniref:Glycosidase n=1 Tax=Sphingomonas caseinilyticus TaxID=2908205 RepID=A0ABT0RU15_9SPHN|nr:glycosidase [Sphingomonas caseinilyticus]MCL6698205.1 glycosidase [Sphingomonas caseinilyticus]
MVAYVVEQVDQVCLTAAEPLRSMDWMSPYVWAREGKLWLMMRGVPKPLGVDDPTGIIWCGCSDDGLNFLMDDKPAIAPGPEDADAGGVEDPTVEPTDDGLFVFFTGVEAGRRQGSLLLATGKDIHSLKKREVILKAAEGEGNIKEATLFRAADDSWRLFYEFARDDASRIGMASGPEIGTEWTVLKEVIPVREDSWDNWHLSPGPIVQCPGRDPVMFYNGATHDARWRIGWVTLDRNCECVTDRGVEPMLVPPPAKDRSETDIAFAASAILQQDGSTHLYYSLEDRMLSRATVRAYD